MKKILAGFLISAAVSQLRAGEEFYDSFNYSPTDVQLATAATPTWVAYPVPAGGVHPTTLLGSLSYPRLQTATGDNSVLFNGAGAAGIAARNLSQVYNIGNVTTLYYSLTFKVTSIVAGDWTGMGNWLNGSFMLGFNQKLQNGTTIAQLDVAAPLLIRTGDPNNLSGMASDFQGYQLGVGVTASTAVPNSRTFDEGHVYNPGDTLFLVLAYTFNPGASDDVAKLYVNPVPGSPEGVNTPAVITPAGLADVNGNQIQSFYLRNNSVEPNGVQIDDLRVGTTWADVTPPFLAILSIHRTPPSDVELTWSAVIGRTYRVQYKNDLTDPDWTDLSPDVTASGNTAALTDISAAGSQRFYRVELLP